jgi:imidazoleglycerol-phosphate dehydratase
MGRTATIERSTNETKVRIDLDLDGRGNAVVTTGIGMFDHLLTSLAHHAMLDLRVSTEGDLVVDDHHTIEDTMLCLGEAIDTALGDRAGIARFGDAAVPMDEAIGRCAIDLGGRPYAVVDLPFRGDRIGAMSTQMVEHGIEALTRTARATVHCSGSGRNDHHVAEAAFKALARSLRTAIAEDDRRDGVASTKGVL